MKTKRKKTKRQKDKLRDKLDKASLIDVENFRFIRRGAIYRDQRSGKKMMRMNSIVSKNELTVSFQQTICTFAKK